MKSAQPSVYGLQPVKELLLEGAPVERIAVARGHHGPGLREVMDLARQGDIPVRQEDRRQLDRWAEGGAHQGVVAWAAALPYHGEEELIAGLGPGALVLVLDGVQDPRNLGALLRTAAAAGVVGVFLPERGAVGLTPIVVKASAGLAGRVPVARAKNLARLLTRCLEPVLEPEIGNTRKVPDVSTDERQVARDDDRCDTQVRLRQPAPFGLEPGTKWTVHLGGPLVEGEHLLGLTNDLTDSAHKAWATALRGAIQKLPQRDRGRELILRLDTGQTPDQRQRRIALEYCTEHIGVETVHAYAISGTLRSLAARRPA